MRVFAKKVNPFDESKGYVHKSFFIDGKYRVFAYSSTFKRGNKYTIESIDDITYDMLTCQEYAQLSEDIVILKDGKSIYATIGGNEQDYFIDKITFDDDVITIFNGDYKFEISGVKSVGNEFMDALYEALVFAWGGNEFFNVEIKRGDKIITLDYEFIHGRNKGA